MSHELIKANLNLYAVLKNLEDLVSYDKEIARFTSDWNISIQFIVKKGPEAYVVFKDGKCTVDRGRYKRPSVKLFFTSPEKLNKMMDGDGTPVILKGFTKLKFLLKDFPVVTDKLEYYLKPTDELLKDKAYLKINTRMTLNTAAFAVREIALLDPIVNSVAGHIRNGAVSLRVLPKGPDVSITFKDGDIKPQKEAVEKTMSYFKSFQEENPEKTPHFLWNAKMRFGKTVTAYSPRSVRARSAGPASGLMGHVGQRSRMCSLRISHTSWAEQNTQSALPTRPRA